MDMHKLKLMAVALLMSGLVGCVEDEFSSAGSSYTGSNSNTGVGDISGGPDSSTDDKLTITSLGSQSFHIDWDKKTQGYSEVIYTDNSNLSDKVRGNDFLTDNYKGLHSLDCYLNGGYFQCQGTGPSMLGGSHSISARLNLNSGVTYYIRVSEGFDHYHGPVLYTMRYSGGILSIKAK
jgi:hypothetical protein